MATNDKWVEIGRKKINALEVQDHRGTDYHSYVCALYEVSQLNTETHEIRVLMERSKPFYYREKDGMLDGVKVLAFDQISLPFKILLEGAYEHDEAEKRIQKAEQNAERIFK